MISSYAARGLLLIQSGAKIIHHFSYQAREDSKHFTTEISPAVVLCCLQEAKVHFWSGVYVVEVPPEQNSQLSSVKENEQKQIQLVLQIELDPVFLFETTQAPPKTKKMRL